MVQRDVKSTDFMFAWRRMLRQPGEYTYLFFYIKGAKAYQDAYADWKSRIDQGQKPPEPSFERWSASVLDAHTLIVTLAHPVPYFTRSVHSHLFPAVRAVHAAFRNWTPRTPTSAATTRRSPPPHLVSNGPYRLEEWSFKRRLRLIASDYYWNRAQDQEPDH